MATAMEIDEVISCAKHANDHLDHLRQVWESQSHWHARRTFIQHNWDNFSDKDRLICLSTTWANINFMGNRYPQKIMTQLKQMENGLPYVGDLLNNGEALISGVFESPVNVEEDQVHEVRKLPVSIKPMRFVKGSKSDEPCSELSSETIKKFEMSNITTDFSNTSSDNRTSGNKLNLSMSKAATSNFNSEIKNVRKETAPPLSVIIENARKKKHKSDDFTNISKRTKLHLNNEKEGKSFPTDKPCITVKKSSKLSNNTLSTHPQKKGAATAFPDQHLCDLVRLLTSVLKEDFYKFNETNKISAFNEIVQKLKTNPVFVCCQVKKNNIVQYNAWAKNLGFTHSVKYGTWVCDLYIYNLFVCQGYGSNKAASKNFAINRALDLLYSPKVRVIYGERLKDDNSKIMQNALNLQSLSHDQAILPPLLVYPNLQDYCFTRVTQRTEGISPAVAKRADGVVVPKKLVIVERSHFIGHHVKVLQESAQFSHLPLDFVNEFEKHQFKCTVVIDSIVIASAFGLTSKDAKALAAESALDILKENCPCVIAQAQTGNLDAALKRNEVVSKKTSNSSSWNKVISNDNMGNKLLRKMGWSGSGGLGKAGGGIATPVQVEGTFNRTGLGHGGIPGKAVSFDDAKRVIIDYVQNNCTGELTFSPDLTSDERKKIHTIASRYGLKSKSYGKDKGRYLVVCRKVSAQDIINGLLEGNEDVTPGYTFTSKRHISLK